MRFNLPMRLHSESEVELKLEPFLSQFFEMSARQVPIQNRVVDFVALDMTGNLIGIEVKVSAWKRALLQAQRNANSFDFLFVCVPDGRYMADLKEQARGAGIGVIVIESADHSVRVELPACQNLNIWGPNQDWIRTIMGDRNSDQY